MNRIEKLFNMIMVMFIFVSAIAGSSMEYIYAIGKVDGGLVIEAKDIWVRDEYKEEEEKVRDYIALMETAKEQEPEEVIQGDPVIEENEVVEEVELSIEEMIYNQCVELEIPYDIVIAIARLETGWFTSDAYIYGNNPGGLSVNECPITFQTKKEGVYAFCNNLSENYFRIGLTTVEAIGSKYCPVNPSWAYLVRSIMD